MDLVFPRNLGPLTYTVPDHLRDAVVPGIGVRAEVRKTLIAGIALRVFESSETAKLKPITEIAEELPRLSEPMLKLIPWMAEYYASKEGAVLGSIFPAEFFKRVRQRTKSAELEDAPPMLLPETAMETELIEKVTTRIKAGGYEAFLMHAVSVGHEAAMLIETVRQSSGSAILIAPDLSATERLWALIQAEPALRADAVLYHSGLSSGARRAALEQMSEGSARIVIGSHAALFAPIKEPALIGVMHEESGLYKTESGPRHHVRDMAVLRAHLGGSVVLLTSVCPSVESMHNARVGKYTLIDQRGSAMSRSGRTLPQVSVLDTSGLDKALSPTLVRAIETALNAGGRVMLMMSRRGYSMLKCADCGEWMGCPECGAPAELYRAAGALRCGRCFTESKPPAKCPKCKGVSITPVGAGIERVEDEIRAIFKGSAKANLTLINEDDDGGLLMGTRALTRLDDLAGQFALVGVINGDAYLYQPDYRASERIFQDLVYASGKLIKGGRLVIQSRRPRAPLMNNLRRMSFRRFYDEELQARREAGYPPFGRLALVSVESQDAPPALTSKDAMVMGPLEARKKSAKGRRTLWKYLVVAEARAGRDKAVRELGEALKEREPLIEIDPVRF